MKINFNAIQWEGTNRLPAGGGGGGVNEKPIHVQQSSICVQVRTLMELGMNWISKRNKFCAYIGMFGMVFFASLCRISL
ncbi:MAG: hypothetical protein ABGX53_02390 [Candidatus Thioglobus sp.]